MRTPSPLAKLLTWWRDALAGRAPALHDSQPQVGWYRRKLVRGGPFVAARIWLEQDIDPETGELRADEVLCCEVAGKRCDPVDQWTYLADNPISEDDFKLMTARAAWAGQHADDHPIANPNKAVDWSTSRIHF